MNEHVQVDFVQNMMDVMGGVFTGGMCCAGCVAAVLTVWTCAGEMDTDRADDGGDGSSGQRKRNRPVRFAVCIPSPLPRSHAGVLTAGRDWCQADGCTSFQKAARVNKLSSNAQAGQIVSAAVLVIRYMAAHCDGWRVQVASGLWWWKVASKEEIELRRAYIKVAPHSLLLCVVSTTATRWCFSGGRHPCLPSHQNQWWRYWHAVEAVAMSSARWPARWPRSMKTASGPVSTTNHANTHTHTVIHTVTHTVIHTLAVGHTPCHEGSQCRETHLCIHGIRR